jgi:hypothetical protein
MIEDLYGAWTENRGDNAEDDFDPDRYSGLILAL